MDKKIRKQTDEENRRSALKLLNTWMEELNQNLADKLKEEDSLLCESND